jgi:hypothetical protein
MPRLSAVTNRLFHGAGLTYTSIPLPPTSITVILTTGTTWTVPANWSSVNTIEVWGGGGGGAFASGPPYAYASGGGGGGYARLVNCGFLTPGQVIPISIGIGGRYFSSVSSQQGSPTVFWSLLRASGGTTGTAYNAYSGGIGLGGTGTSYSSGAAFQRPSSPTSGSVYYNTTTGYIEQWTGSTWAQVVVNVPNTYTLLNYTGGNGGGWKTAGNNNNPGGDGAIDLIGGSAGGGGGSSTDTSYLYSTGGNGNSNVYVTAMGGYAGNAASPNGGPGNSNSNGGAGGGASYYRDGIGGDGGLPGGGGGAGWYGGGGGGDGQIRITYTPSAGPVTYSSITWTTETRTGATNETPTAWAQIEYNGTVYFGLTNSSNKIISRNAAGSWSTISLPAPTTNQGVTGLAAKADNSLWVAMGDKGTCSWTSTDQGGTWTVHNFSTVILSGGYLSSGFTYSNGYFIIMTSTSLTQVLSSPDGYTWTNLGTITGSQTSAYNDPGIIITNPAQTQALGTSQNTTNYSYVNTSSNTWSMLSSASYGYSIGSANNSGATYSSESGFMIGAQAGSTLYYASSPSGFFAAGVSSTLHGASGGLAGIRANNTGTHSVLLASPFTQSTTWRINYSLATASAWTNTTVPISAANGYLIGTQGNRFISFVSGTTNVCVGTLS